MAGKSRRARSAAKLAAKSAYLRSQQTTSLTLPSVEQNRDRLGGQISPRPTQRTRWLMADREAAIQSADAGNMQLLALLWRSILTDGTFAGALSTRTAGVANLPKRFRGDAEMVAELELGHESVRSVYDEMLPPDELSAMLRECIGIGVSVAELRPVEGREYPVLRRLDPAYLVYRWAEGTWYYTTNFGPIPIIPGDGRWVLMTLGTEAPWQLGICQYASRAWLAKEHAGLMAQAYEKCLANPARVATAPQGSTELDRERWFEAVAAWGVDTIFLGLPGYEIKLLESQGTGWQSFQKSIQRCNEELLMAANGQTVTATGGTGFINGDLFKNVAQSLIKQGADLLAYTVNTQCIPQWVAAKYGVEAIDYGPCVDYDSKPPTDLSSSARAITDFATALSALTSALAPYPYRVDLEELRAQFGLAIVSDPTAVHTSGWSEADARALKRTVEAAQSAGLTPTEDSASEVMSASGLAFEPYVPPVEGPAAPPEKPLDPPDEA